MTLSAFALKGAHWAAAHPTEALALGKTAVTTVGTVLTAVAPVALPVAGVVGLGVGLYKLFGE